MQQYDPLTVSGSGKYTTVTHQSHPNYILISSKNHSTTTQPNIPRIVPKIDSDRTSQGSVNTTTTTTFSPPLTSSYQPPAHRANHIEPTESLPLPIQSLNFNPDINLYWGGQTYHNPS